MLKTCSAANSAEDLCASFKLWPSCHLGSQDSKIPSCHKEPTPTPLWSGTVLILYCHPYKVVLFACFVCFRRSTGVRKSFSTSQTPKSRWYRLAFCKLCLFALRARASSMCVCAFSIGCIWEVKRTFNSWTLTLQAVARRCSVLPLDRRLSAVNKTICFRRANFGVSGFVLFAVVTFLPLALYTRHLVVQDKIAVINIGTGWLCMPKSDGRF